MSRITDIEECVHYGACPPLTAIRWLADRYRRLMETNDARRNRILEYQEKLRIANDAGSIMRYKLKVIARDNPRGLCPREMARQGLIEERERRGV